ncbi:MAG: hypothetical protein ACXVA9_09390 [Bdellovibrionales bacterium]
MRHLILFLFLLSFSPAHAEGGGDWFFLPAVGIGYNSVQGSSLRLGADLGFYIDENLYAGIGGYYASGSKPEHDRELGAGPFVGYVYPVVSFLSLQLREDIDYVDQRTPVLKAGSSDEYTHTQDHGVVSETYGGVHISFSRNFGISAGYRAVIGLSKASLATGRSGTVLGLTIGI